MSELGSAIDGLAVEDLDGVTDAVLSADVVELRRQCDRLVRAGVDARRLVAARARREEL